MEEVNWETITVSEDFFLQSGLLFEINRSILHLVGLALTIKKDENNKLAFTIRDCRKNPEACVFDKETYKKATKRLKKFMVEFGHKQMQKRSKRLGWSCQSAHYDDK
jgi:hypothetical protein